MLLGALACLSTGERVRLREAAKAATDLERRWRHRFNERIAGFDAWVFESLFEHGRFAESQIDFLPLVLQHSYEASAVGMRTARRDAYQERLPLKLAATPPGPRIPKNLGDLKRLYDRWKRTSKNAPPRQRQIAERLKKEYLARVQSVWERYGSDFREGKSFDRDAVTQVLKQKGDMARARAETVVQTETTYYYNKARRTVYDRSDDVTHYLFVAIRDKATTKWCKTRQGLVYAKGDPLLEKETPPIHWNCRSEILPLSELNPRHLLLIQDASRWRRNHRCEPLPAGWSKR